MANKPEMPAPLAVHLEEALAGGVFSNALITHHNDAEFTLDFLHVRPGQAKAVIRARVITCPQHVKRMAILLQQMIMQYEQKHGVVTPAEPAPVPEGYH